MANAVLSTKLSRRTMLAGGALAALHAAARSAAAAPACAPVVPASPGAAGACGPDAELLRRIAAAADLWAEYVVADAHCRRLHEALRRHKDYPAKPISEAGSWAVEALAQRTGYREADDAAVRLYERHEAALRAAFAVPARTLPGLHAKLRCALAAAKERDAGTFEESDYQWLDDAMADMDRMAAGRWAWTGRRQPRKDF